MKIKCRIWILGIALCCAGYAEHPAFIELRERVRASFKAHMMSDPSMLDIDGINRAYLSLPVIEMSRRDLLEAKFLHAHWQEVTSLHLMSRIKDSQNEVAIIEGLADLKLPLLSIDTEFLFQKMMTLQDSRRDLYAALLGGLGESSKMTELLKDLRDSDLRTSLRRLQGPPLHPKIRPYGKNALWGHPPPWMSDPAYGEYLFRGEDEVFFRGYWLKSGTILISDLGRYGDGILSAFTQDPEVVNHTGVFWIDRNEAGQLVPVVAEMHERGKRRTPLSTWLSARHNFHAIAVRPRGLPDDIGLRCHQTFLELPDLAYDFHAKRMVAGGYLPKNGAECTCSNFAQYFFARMGYPLPDAFTKFHPLAMRSLTSVGLGVNDGFYSPTDIYTSPGLDVVAVFDTRRLMENVTRLAAIGNVDVPKSFGHQFAHYVVDPSKLPLRYQIEEFKIALGQNRKGFLGALSRLGCMADGFRPNEVPTSAKPITIAFYYAGSDVIDGVITKMVKESCPAILGALAENKPFSIHDLMNHPQVRERAEALYREAGVHEWFFNDNELSVQ